MKNIFYLFLVFSITSCDMETVVDLEIPAHEPVLVLNGLLKTDTISRVVVSQSVGAFSNLDPSFVNDANVSLYKDNEFIGLMEIDTSEQIYFNFINNGGFFDSIPTYYYKNNHIPEKGSTYRITVDHTDFPSISAETYVPNDIILYDVNIDTVSNEDLISFSFSFDDNATIQNYYGLELYANCSKTWDDEYGYFYEEYFSGYAEFLSNDPSFPVGIPFEGYTFSGDNVVFTDALFNGQQKTINLDVETYLEFKNCDTVIITFSNFSDDTYSYFNSLGDHIDKGELGLFGGEVTPVYSNVKNGLGVLISNYEQKLYLKP
tara:strand:- start:7913 stop:8866 length:954 start_codon:yes stop_codon:yes gene_type:complete